MPRFQTEMTFARPIEEVFDFFRRSANIIRTSPPDLNLQLLEAPELLQQGSRIVLQARRFGIAQRIESEVVALDLNALLVDEGRAGPFRKWVQTHRFEKTPQGTRVRFQIDYEPPGGLLGLLVTAAAMGREIQSVFAFRGPRLHELLDPPGTG
jgi:ligand-binding SRPBCC domain-containing protein